MDDYPGKQIVSTFTLTIVNVELEEIEDVKLEVGELDFIKKFKLKVDPYRGVSQLMRTSEIKLIKPDGSLAELPDFMVYNENDFSVEFRAGSEESIGTYQVIVFVDFPQHPGLTVSREFEVEVVLMAQEVGFWDENWGASSDIVDQTVELGCGDEWKLEIPYALNNILEEHVVRVKTVRRGAAYTFVDYDAQTREFLIRPDRIINKRHNGTYKVGVALDDS